MKLQAYFTTILSVTVCLAGCIEIYPLTPPKELLASPSTGSVCLAPPIEKNIVGKWHFESNYNPGLKVTSGSVTFEADGKITDPDSLLPNRLDLGYVVIRKSYFPAVVSTFPIYSGKLFEMHSTAKQGTQKDYFTVVSNECNRIHIRLFLVQDNGIGIVLTR